MSPSSNPPTLPPPLTLTARTPADVLALVPVVLGFTPGDSIAMLTFGARHPFHARVDLPPPGLSAAEHLTALDEMVDSLLTPASHHGVRRTLFVVYTCDAVLGREAAARLVAAFVTAGIEVVDALRADGSRWWPALGPRVGVPAAGVPYDVSSHPFTAHAVLDGRVLRGSREELGASLAADRAAVDQVVAALAGVTAGAGEGEAAEWAVALLDHHCREGTVPTDLECARLLRALLATDVRDAVCRDLDRASAPAHVAFWTGVVRRSPDVLLAAPAALLALAAWQAGHGALAWCALDRCADADPEYPLAQLVARALAEALPPDAWDAAW